jgi:integrase
MAETPTRRSYGTGSLFVRADASGREAWYGQWRLNARLVKRKVGPKRSAGAANGLTKAQAEKELRRLVAATVAAPTRERVTVAEAGRRHLEQLAALGRKRSTLMDYESALRVHLAPYFGTRAIDSLTAEDVERFVAAKRREGRAQKSVRNYAGFLHGICAFAVKRGWANVNPCAAVELPRAPDGEQDIRFLDVTELEALLRAAPRDHLGLTEYALYLTTAMTGLRQGELLALRWRDVDWLAGRLRVRRSYVRGEFGTPKSRRGARAVPLADRVAAALEDHFRTSAYSGDDDLVFAHPQLGSPLDRSKVLKRFRAAAGRAGIRDAVRFHDLRHTFGTRMAAAGVPMRTLQEWLGHRDFKTTLIYADCAPSEREREFVERAFAPPVAKPGAGVDTAGSARLTRPYKDHEIS